MTKRLTGLPSTAYRGVEAITPPNSVAVNRPPEMHDKKNYNLGDFWLDTSQNDLWVLVSLAKDGNGVQQATWINLTSGAVAANTLTGNTGGAVSPDGANNIDVLGDTTVGLTVTGNPGNNQLLITTVDGNSILQSLTGNTGGAVFPDGNQNIDLLGDTSVGVTVTGNPGTNTLTITSTSGNGFVQTLTGDSGGAVGPDGSFNINLLGGTGAVTAGTPGTNTITIAASGAVPLQFDTDSGSAVPAANVINIVGTPASIIQTSGATDTVTVNMENGTDGQVIIGGGSDPAWANITSTGGTVTITEGANTINLETNPPAATSSFFAYDASTQSNVTGDGTTYTVLFRSTTINAGSDYSTGTSTYTAPIDGVYTFFAQVPLLSPPGAGLEMDIHILINGALITQGSTFPTSNRVANFFGSDNTIHNQASVMYQLSAGDLVTVTIGSTGGAKTADVLGFGSPRQCFFWGKLEYGV